MEGASASTRSTVWLVEDSPLEAEVAKRALITTYDVTLFAEGAAMIERLAAAPPPTVIILDWRLPGLSGLEVCKFVRASWNQNALPILMLTGLSERADLVDAISAGANDYLTKPYDSTELLARVATVVRTRELNDRLELSQASEREARREAQSANLAKDEFLAMTSHELRTPLHAILGWATLMRSGQLDASAYFRAIETIERNARIQGKLIEDILDCSRIISGNLRIDDVALNLGGVVKAAIEALHPASRKQGVELSVAIDPTATQMKGDPERLQQIAWNLISNAIKFTPKGGTVSVELQRSGTTARLTVRDTGEGIDPKFLPHVFERFRQAQTETTTRRHGGLGLGLAVVRSLVEAHHGTVSASSEGLGKGSTFEVTFPILESTDNVVSERPTPLGPRAARLDDVKVLVVDDEADGRELVMTALRLHGADVVTADSVENGLNVIDAHNPLVLVSDIGMPVVDGLEFIRMIRQRANAKGGRMVAVAVSAYARDEDRQRALDAGFDDYLAKPLNPDELVSLVAELLSRRENETGDSDA